MSKALDPKDTCVLVTGGAGFIGSHTVVQLLEGGYQVVIVDDLSNSSAVAVDRVKTIVGDEAAKNLTFYEANVLDRDAMNKIFDTHQIDRVIHFAGFKAVGESVSKPVEYYHNNIENTLVLIDVMRSHGCKSIIFSSSSTVYGDPNNPPVTEEDPKKPATNPYGWTKWMIDLASGHVAALNWMNGKTGVEIFNLGTGTGTSVLEVVAAFSKACGKELPYVIRERRAGDIAANWCDASKAERMMGWKAQYDIADMCRDSWNWQSHNPNGFADAE